MIFLWYTRILKGLYQGEVPWMANVYRHFPTATSSERFKADHISESEVSKWIASYQRCPWEAKTTGLARATASDYYRCHYCSPSYNREVFVTVSWNKRINRKKVYPSCDCPGFAWRTNCFDNKPQLTTTYLPATILKVPSAQTFNHFQLAIRLAVSLTNFGIHENEAQFRIPFGCQQVPAYHPWLQNPTTVEIWLSTQNRPLSTPGAQQFCLPATDTHLKTETIHRTKPLGNLESDVAIHVHRLGETK